MYTKLHIPSVISLATNPWTSLASKIGNSLSLRAPAWLPEMQGCQSFTLAEAIVRTQYKTFGLWPKTNYS